MFLGTGTPLPDPDRSGPATAVVVDGAAYLFDAGAGVCVARRLVCARASPRSTPSTSRRRSSRTSTRTTRWGLPDLMLTPWTMGRTEPLELYGPVGTRAMTDGIQKAWALDIDRRLHDLQPSTPRGWQVNVHEISGDPGGVIFRGRACDGHGDPGHPRRVGGVCLSRPDTRPDHRHLWRCAAESRSGQGLSEVRPADLRGLHDGLNREGDPAVARVSTGLPHVHAGTR